MFRHACRLGLEGIVSKKLAARTCRAGARAGVRSRTPRTNAAGLDSRGLPVQAAAPMNFATRKRLYKKIETERSTKVLTFVTGDRPGMETQIAQDSVNLFVDLLDKIGPT